MSDYFPCWSVTLSFYSGGQVTGQCFEIVGGRLSIADGWRTGPEIDKGARWHVDELADAVDALLTRAKPAQPLYGS